MVENLIAQLAPVAIRVRKVKRVCGHSFVGQGFSAILPCILGAVKKK
jgi:hypothetical protein